MKIFNLKKENNNYLLIDTCEPELLNIVAKYPWTITHPGLIKENCDEIFENMEKKSIFVFINKKKKINSKFCYLIEKCN
jgi:hypothetical protein